MFSIFKNVTFFSELKWHFFQFCLPWNTWQKFKVWRKWLCCSLPVFTFDGRSLALMLWSCNCCPMNTNSVINVVLPRRPRRGPPTFPREADTYTYNGMLLRGHYRSTARISEPLQPSRVLWSPNGPHRPQRRGHLGIQTPQEEKEDCICKPFQRKIQEKTLFPSQLRWEY